VLLHFICNRDALGQKHDRLGEVYELNHKSAGKHLVKVTLMCFKCTIIQMLEYKFFMLKKRTANLAWKFRCVGFFATFLCCAIIMLWIFVI